MFVRWVGQNLSSKHYKFLSRLNTTVRYSDTVRTKPRRRDFIYNNSYSIFIFKLTMKSEKIVCFTEANPTLRAYRDYTDNAINMLSPGCPASA